MISSCFDISNYGAVPTSVDAAFDSTPAIQKAIDLARESLFCKMVYVPPQVFFVPGQLVNYDKVIFVGQTTPRDYWTGANFGDVFEESASVLRGNGKNELFGPAGQGWHFTCRNLSFTGFSRLVAPSSPRTANFNECSFKNMRVLDAPSNTTAQYHNFKFWRCAFTIYNVYGDPVNKSAFNGRLIDCEWSFNIFCGNKGFDLTQARANRIFMNRFEWIDREAAISLYGCDNNMIQANWFDRVSGVGVQLKQQNKDISITGNTFSRCGSLLTSGGSTMNLPESYQGYIQVYGDQNGNLQIDNNHFIKGTCSDASGSLIVPHHVLCLEGIGGKRKFTFRDNTFDDGNAYTDTLIYASAPWIPSVTTITTDGYFDHLDESVISLAKYSSGRLLAANTEDVALAEIPEKLTVQNYAAITLTGPQTGLVYGGRVNGKPRYGRPEQLYENLGAAESANGSAAGNKISYTVPVNQAMRGAPVYFAANYRTYGLPDCTVELVGADGVTVIATLPKLVVSNPSGGQQMYTARFVIPDNFADASIKVNIYAAKAAALTAGDTVIVDGFSAVYGDFITKGVTDVKFTY